jgi:predicted metal-dependent hydrolase
MRRNHRHYIKHKETARELATRKVSYFNEFYKHRYNKIHIRNQKTRWGSCSKQGNLNFNYKILFLPEKASDYIIVHELCHLKEFNHSPKFWNLVAKKFPDYREIKRALRNTRTKRLA